MDAQSSSEAQTAPNADQRYCSECGKIILRRAEICPNCGCRQFTAPIPTPPQRMAPIPDLDSPLAGRVVLLLLLNLLWSGLGNIAVGDKRGWSYGFLNWIVFGIGFFTGFIPCLFFYGFCGYMGYQFLHTQILADDQSRPVISYR